MSGRLQVFINVHWSRLFLTGSLFVVLLMVTLREVTINLWRQDEHGYVPFLLALNLGLFGFNAKNIQLSLPQKLPIPVVFLLLVGCLGYGLGQAQNIMLLEIAGFYLLLVATLLTIGGYDLIRKLNFPLLFMLFVIPYPSWMVDYLTIPLKVGISQAAATLLYALDYPIAQSGVVLALGPYRLLVMDACSGLHSLIFLAAMGLLYIHLTERRQTWHRFVLIASLIPIGIVANFVRILLLLLITYHMGDTVGQSYWHNLAGLLLFLSAFIVLYLLDSLLFRLHKPCAPDSEVGNGRAQDLPPPCAFQLSGVRSSLLSVSFLLSLLLPHLITTHPMADQHSIPQLEKLVPQQFADWQHDTVTDQWLVTPTLFAAAENNGHQTLARTYINLLGQRVMLLISYGDDQNNTTFEEHRPEYCYKAQGFTIIKSHTADLSLNTGILPVKQLVAQQYTRFEPITYWMTIGEYPTLPGISRRLHKLRYALKGLNPDGMLVRVSSIDSDQTAAFALQSRFIADLKQVIPLELGFGGLK